MQDEIKKLGQLFKAKRDEMQLTLKDVENSTSIRSNYLSAIEEGKIDQFFSSVYITGFIRQYAVFLDLDVEKVMTEFPEVFKAPNQKHDFAYGIGTLEVRNSVGSSAKWIPNLLWTGASIVVIILAWYLAKNTGLF